jgi:hypothetical protein
MPVDDLLAAADRRMPVSRIVRGALNKPGDLALATTPRGASE